MLPILWLPSASEDLTDIIDFIADRNLTAAIDLQDVIEQSTSRLPQHPYIYRTGRVAGTREMVVHPNYLVIYRVGATAIEILGVLHTRLPYP
jgi:toxin ParE1/3/4